MCVFDLFMCIPLETGKHFIFVVSQYVSQIFTSWYVLSRKKKLKEKVSVVCSVSGKVVDFLVPLHTRKALVNSKLEKVKEWCDVSKLSMNTAKTKFMIIKSSKKKDMFLNIQIRNKDETYYPRVRKDHIK